VRRPTGRTGSSRLSSETKRSRRRPRCDPSGPIQTFFGLWSGQFAAGGGSETATEEAASDGGELDPDIEDVLDELRGTDVNDTSPLELMGRVQEWQRRLTDE
jgi:DNA mismatch repair protein MutS